MSEDKMDKKEEIPPKKEETKKEATDGYQFKDLIERIEKLTVVDLAKLVKELEEKLGVSPQAGFVPQAGAGEGQAPASEGEGAAEKSAYTVLLESAGDQKIQVIKAVREINQMLGLKEAKDMVEAAPKEVKKDVPKAEAEEALKKLQVAGAKASLK